MRRALRLAALLLAAVPGGAQEVAFVGAIGQYNYFRPPALAAGFEARHDFHRFSALGEAGATFARKPDVEDRMDYRLRLRAVGAVNLWRHLRVGAGYDWRHLWTSEYEKTAANCLLYAGWRARDWSLEGFGAACGDARNGSRGLEEGRVWMAVPRRRERLRLGFSYQLERAHPTDRAGEPLWVGGASFRAAVCVLRCAR